MAYNTKAIKTDVNAKPIPQLYNPVTDEYEVLQGVGGAARQVLYGSDGQPISTTEGKLAVRAAEVETAVANLQTALLDNQSTAAKQDALAGLVGAIDSAAVSDPAAAGAVIALLKGVLERFQAVEGKIEAVRVLLNALTGEDFATQTTLAQILAKMIASPATEAKQDSLATLVGAIEDKLDGEDFATQTTLAQILAKMIASPATEAKQDVIAGHVDGVETLLTALKEKDFATQATLATVLERFQAVEGKIDAIMDGTTPAKTQLTGSIVEEITLQNEVIAPADGTTVAMGGRDKIKIEITGTATSSTVVFEVAGASGVFTPCTGVKLSDYTMATQTVGRGEIWAFDSIACLTFRARVSAVAGGNVSVVGLVVA